MKEILKAIQRERDIRGEKGRSKNNRAWKSRGQGKGVKQVEGSYVKADLSFRSNNYLLKAKDTFTVIVARTTGSNKFVCFTRCIAYAERWGVAYTFPLILDCPLSGSGISLNSTADLNFLIFFRHLLLGTSFIDVMNILRVEQNFPPSFYYTSVAV